MRLTVAEALAAIGPAANEAIPALITLLDDQDAGVRQSAVQAIGRIGPPAAMMAVEQLVLLLSGEELYVRMAAATALGRIGPAAQAALAPLRSLIDDPAIGAEARWAIARITNEQFSSVELDGNDESSKGFSATASQAITANGWPMLGGRPDRNAVVFADVPIAWDLLTGENVLWQVPLGDTNFAGPSVAGGRVFIGTDNGLKRDPKHVKPQGILAAFAAHDGKFLWQDTSPYLQERGLIHTLQPYTTSTPLIEGNRLYYVTAQAQIRCLDVEGFTDGENDGPWTSEPDTEPHNADLVWEIDMGLELGVYPHEAPNCSIVSVGDLLMVGTSNGVDVSHTGVPLRAHRVFSASTKRPEMSSGKSWALVLRCCMGNGVAQQWGKWETAGWFFSVEAMAGSMPWIR